MGQGKRAESRCRYLTRNIAQTKGWNIQHPSKGGNFLEEQEITDYFGDFGLNKDKPDFVVCKDYTPLIVVEAKNDEKKINEADIEETLCYGKEIINTKFIIDKIDKEEFKKKLSKVVLYRIEVPVGTDLNRYFEIMNTRGEQLEQHDVLKAKFMELIGESEIRNNFAEVWEACSDMTGYVQMNMSKQLREKIFGKSN